MLNIEVNRSAEGVERYFDRELARITPSLFFAEWISAPNRTATSYTMRLAEWWDSIRARWEDSSPA
jgi:hypothetical protein